jgi:hypothetical protein
MVLQSLEKKDVCGNGTDCKSAAAGACWHWFIPLINNLQLIVAFYALFMYVFR